MMSTYSEVFGIVLVSFLIFSETTAKCRISGSARCQEKNAWESSMDALERQLPDMKRLSQASPVDEPVGPPKSPRSPSDFSIFPLPPRTASNTRRTEIHSPLEQDSWDNLVRELTHIKRVSQPGPVDEPFGPPKPPRPPTDGGHPPGIPQPPSRPPYPDDLMFPRRAGDTRKNAQNNHEKQVLLEQGSLDGLVGELTHMKRVSPPGPINDPNGPPKIPNPPTDDQPAGIPQAPGSWLRETFDMKRLSPPGPVNDPYGPPKIPSPPTDDQPAGIPQAPGSWLRETFDTKRLSPPGPVNDPYGPPKIPSTPTDDQPTGIPQGPGSWLRETFDMKRLSPPGPVNKPSGPPKIPSPPTDGQLAGRPQGQGASGGRDTFDMKRFNPHPDQ